MQQLKSNFFPTTTRQPGAAGAFQRKTISQQPLASRELLQLSEIAKINVKLFNWAHAHNTGVVKETLYRDPALARK